MSNELSEEAREWVNQIAQPGTVFRWEWTVDGAGVVAYVEVSRTNPGNSIEVTRWNLSGRYEFSRPTGVPRGGNIPFQAFYDAAKAGNVQLVNLVGLSDSDTEIVRKLLVRFMDEGRDTFQTGEVIDACYGDKSHPLVHPDRIRSVLYQLQVRRLLSWHEARLDSDTQIRITDKGREELRNPTTNRR